MYVANGSNLHLEWNQDLFMNKFLKSMTYALFLILTNYFFSTLYLFLMVINISFDKICGKIVLLEFAHLPYQEVSP